MRIWRVLVCAAPAMDHVSVPPTCYAQSAGAKLAFQVSGDGPCDLVFVPGLVSHLDLQWQQLSYRRFVNALERVCRVIRFDKRGTGLSDPTDTLPGLAERATDLAAVMDAAGSQAAASPGMAAAVIKSMSRADVSHLLAAVRAPALVVHREQDLIPLADARAVAAELLAYCRTELTSYKCPRSVDFTGELPRELYKRRLRERYWAGRGSVVI